MDRLDFIPSREVVIVEDQAQSPDNQTQYPREQIQSLSECQDQSPSGYLTQSPSEQSPSPTDNLGKSPSGQSPSPTDNLGKSPSEQSRTPADNLAKSPTGQDKTPGVEQTKTPSDNLAKMPSDNLAQTPSDNRSQYFPSDPAHKRQKVKKDSSHNQTQYFINLEMDGFEPFEVVSSESPPNCSERKTSHFKPNFKDFNFEAENGFVMISDILEDTRTEKEDDIQTKLVAHLNTKSQKEAPIYDFPKLKNSGIA